MTRIALVGAGGKMGVRLAANLKGSRYDVLHVEKSEAGRERLLKTTGAVCVEMEEAVASADVVILAVPDNLIGIVAKSIIGQVRPNAAIIMLDAAAPFAGDLPRRDDITYFVTHPCHPSIFNDESDPEARKDYFGGVRAKQAIVCALIQGPEEHYAICEDIAKVIYGPVTRSHRCTLENIAVLEPALSETIGATFCMALREATEMAIGKGVPREAAVDFMLGHLNIELSIAFDQFPEGKFSDGAIRAIEEAKPVIFKEGWLKRVFADDELLRSVRMICDPKQAA